MVLEVRAHGFNRIMQRLKDLNYSGVDLDYKSDNWEEKCNWDALVKDYRPLTSTSESKFIWAIIIAHIYIVPTSTTHRVAEDPSKIEGSDRGPQRN